MDYVTRQFINLAKKFRKEIPKLAKLFQDEAEKHIEAIRAANKRNEQQQQVHQEWFGDVLTKYKKAESDRGTRDDRQYRVQNSIRWATWCAFLAASIYAGLSACLLIETKRAAVAAEQSAAYAGVQAQHAGEQVSQAHEQYINSIRPIVWVTQLGTPEYFPNPNTNPQTGQITWTYHYTAFGNNLAYNVATIYRAYKLGKTGAWRNSYGFKSSPMHQSLPIAPGTDMFSTEVSAPGVTQKEFADLNGTDEGITIKMVMQFEDSYGTTYYTGICLSKLRLGSIQYCDGSYMSSKEKR